VFNKLKNAFAGKVNKYSGKKDFLEAVCAACALVAAADGDLEDAEIAQTIKGIQSNPELAGAFPSREIEQTADQMLKRAQGGRVGRNGLFKELEDIASDKDMAETVLLTALDVADSDGEMEPAEKAVLEKIAQTFGLNLASYL
jgi:tellurite resistance protein TerB